MPFRRDVAHGGRSRQLLIACVLLILALFSPPLRSVVRLIRTRWTVQQVLQKADDPRFLGVRLSRPATFVFWTSKTPATLAADLRDLAGTNGSPEAQYAEGLALLLGGRVSDAARHLRAAVAHAPSSSWWSDLAAVEFLVALKTNDPEHLLDAFAAVDRALEIDPDLPEALFNRAVLVEEMGLRHPAVESWHRFIQREHHMPWSNEALRRLHNDEILCSDAEEWKRLNVGTASLTPMEITRATQRLPEQAHRAAEGPLLATWAAEIEAGKVASALRTLAIVRVIGYGLQQRYGDSTVADAVEVIDRAGDADRHGLAEAYMAYRSGRWALRTMDVERASHAFADAVKLFSQTGSPMAFVASYYAAATMRNANRIDEARQRLERLLDKVPLDRYPSIAAQARRELSLCYGALGRWHDAVVAAEAAAEIFRRLGERQNAGDVGIVRIGLSDMTGQRAEYVELVLNTLRQLSAAGADDRVAAALAAAGHAEVRRGRWDTARAFAMIERELPATRNDPQLRADNLIRLAAIELNDGNAVRAEQTIARASAAAGVVPGQLGLKLRADVDAVGGAIVRRRDPTKAIPLLTRSIAFQQRSGRVYALPELYLESARARAGVGDPAGAAADYDAGIAVLERQRANAAQAWRRIGIFDNAIHLFGEAATLALKRGDAGRALVYVERRRARVLLDELVPAHKQSPSEFDAPSLCASVPSNAVLLEYATLGQSVEVFAVTREYVKVRHLDISVSQTEAQIRVAMDALMRGGNSHLALLRLYTLLIGPVSSLLDGHEMLIIVPEPWLQRVPFAALIDPRRRRYVIEQQVVVLAPSVATFVASAANVLTISSRRSAATFGNPTLGSASNFGPLPLAAKEAAMVADLYPQSARWIDSTATKEAFISALRTFDFVHYAGHAIGVAREPWRSALLFSSGALTAREIVTSQGVAAHVVVLAACSTARSAPAVEGSPVLAQAFLIAGVRTVVGTLWDIEDGDAGPLMCEFHKHLAHGMRPAIALRQAQLSMLRNPQAAQRNPLRWASFACIGAP